MNQASQILAEVKKAVCGKDRVLVWVLTVILARGHVLLEDIPGVGKTTMALAFSRALGLDYCGVDLLFGGSGALVCEVNSNAFFRTFESATGINVAAAYARYTVEKAMAARK